MSTSCTVKVEGVDFAKLYIHWDGYPDGQLEWLTNFSKDFAVNRGSDPAYKFAQLIRTTVSVNSEGKIERTYTGYGVEEFDSSCGEEYEYTLHTDGTVTWEEM